MGVATDCSMVSASAPVYVVWIWMMGGMMDGYCATGRPARATTPRITVRIAMTMATIGRSTKKRVTGWPRPPEWRAPASP